VPEIAVGINEFLSIWAYCPHMEQHDFNQLANAILVTLAGCPDPGIELTVLALAAAECLADIDPEHRPAARAALITAIDDMTRERVIARCDT
jgi:hypothetical protein